VILQVIFPARFRFSSGNSGVLSPFLDPIKSLWPRHLNLDFPFGFLPTTGMGVFRDFLPLQQVCKSFFQSALGFS
jgi:hypothetical protein